MHNTFHQTSVVELQCELAFSTTTGTAKHHFQQNGFETPVRLPFLAYCRNHTVQPATMNVTTSTLLLIISLL